MERLKVDGRFFRKVQGGKERIFLRCVTYGPFPDTYKISHPEELLRISNAGFHAIRIYEYPSAHLLDAAAANNLYVWVTLPWAWGGDFRNERSRYSEALVRIGAFLKTYRNHPALAGLLVANEIPADIVRFIGPTWVKAKLEELIDYARSLAPELLFAYSNYPTTEYLEPENADFSCFNIYLENENDFREYMARLHHISSDRPIFISEFGLDTIRSSEEEQAEILKWAFAASHELGLAGFTIFSWSDAWQNGAREMTDWNFGLTREDHSAKPALQIISQEFQNESIDDTSLLFSIIVCTYNGAQQIADCLTSLGNLDYPNYEIIVVNDGSTDSTESIVKQFPHVQLINQPNKGLSTARNVGAAHAEGDIFAFTDDDCQVDHQWLNWLNKAYQDETVAACGGPNIPPPAKTITEAVIAASPGSPSHVLKNDTSAEHIPGCNLTVRREAFEHIKGFDKIFRIAGDDVDFCWRLEDAGYRIAFAACAFVWHRRRATFRTFWKQQREYGKAEALLFKKHPQRFTNSGSINWQGVVYTGAPIAVTNDAAISFGDLAENPYQSAIRSHQALRPLQLKHQTTLNNILLELTKFLQPVARWLGRRTHGLKASLYWPPSNKKNITEHAIQQHLVIKGKKQTRHNMLRKLMQEGWESAHSHPQWDLSKDDNFLTIAIEQHEGEDTNVLLKTSKKSTINFTDLLSF